MKYPITPEWMETAPDKVVGLYQNLEEFVLGDICRRFKTSGEATESAMAQIKILQDMGYDLGGVEEYIKETLRLSDREYDDIFDRAVERNREYYDHVIEKADIVVSDFDRASLDSDVEAIRAQTKGELQNITQSLGFAIRAPSGAIEFLPIAEAYQRILDDAEFKVWSGASSYNEAVKSAVKQLADSGLQWVDYESGHRNRIDVAARRAVMTGITQLSSQYSEKNAEFLDTPYREVTAHIGARDIDKPNPWSNHKRWQGKVYSIRTGDKYPSIYTQCGWGEVDGLEGANCRHLHYPFVDGVSERTYTDEELANIDPPPKSYQGREYNAYAATQKQRQIETAIRQTKRELVAYEKSGAEEEYTDAAVRYRRLTEAYRDFSKSMGLPTQPERAQILDFGPGQASAAIQAARKSND